MQVILTKTTDLQSQYKYLIYAFLLLLPTFAGVHAEYFLLFILTVLIIEFKRLTEMWKAFRAKPFEKKHRIVWWVVLIMVLSLGNKILNGSSISGLSDYYAAFYLFPFLILTSRLSFSQELFKFLLLITGVEVLVGIAEYAVGIRSFFLELYEFNTIQNYSLLYDSRVYGLSPNSSVMGYKMLAAFILLDFVRLKTWLMWILRALLIIGTLICFSRTVILVLLIYWTFSLIYGLIKNGKHSLRNDSIVFLASLMILIVAFSGPLKNQSLRGYHQADSGFTPMANQAEESECETEREKILVPGKIESVEQGWGEKVMVYAEGVQTSGRKLIWINYLNFIEKNLWFGNGSNKLIYYMELLDGGSKKMHAHNSFLQLIGTHGSLIALMFFVFYIWVFTSRNFLAVMAIVLYSFGNYGIFWGFSYIDAIFMMLLIFELRPNYDYARDH